MNWGLFLLILIPVLIYRRKIIARKNESLKECLLRVCNPSNFLTPFDKDKVNASNKIYAQINNTNADDIDSLKSLRKEAAKILGISFIDSKLIESLRGQCNPQRFMNPYDEAKVNLAADLYERLQNCTDIDEFELIKEQAKKLG
jgi:hypothetical protein